MTKNELAEKVAASNGLGASQARQVVETVIDAVSDELAGGGEAVEADFAIGFGDAPFGGSPAV